MEGGIRVLGQGIRVLGWGVRVLPPY